MKRIISVVLLIGIILSLCACADESKRVTDSQDPLDYNTDFQYYYSNINGFNSSITKSDTGYYMFLPDSRFLYFIDRETLEATPLCSRVNCTHRDKKICQAYFNTFIANDFGNRLQYNNDMLYMLLRNEDEFGNFFGTSLYNVSPDGAQRNELVTFDKDGFEHWLIHRGYFYYIDCEYSENAYDYSTYDKFCIYRLSLDNLKAKPQLLFDSKDYSEHISGSSGLSAYGDYLFTVIEPITEEEIKRAEKKKEAAVSYKTDYYTINTNTLSVNHIENSDGEVVAPTFYNNGLLYATINDKTQRYYKSDLDGSNPVFVKEMKYADNLFSDGCYMYMQNTDEYTNASEDSYQGERLNVLNSDFSQKYSTLLPINKYSLSYCTAQDPEYFIFIYNDDPVNYRGEYEIRLINKKELESCDKNTACFKTVYRSSFYSDSYI